MREEHQILKRIIDLLLLLPTHLLTREQVIELHHPNRDSFVFLRFEYRLLQVDILNDLGR